MAVKFQRIRPYWLGVNYLNDHARFGYIEVGADGGLEAVKATDSIKGHLEKAVSEINSKP